MGSYVEPLPETLKGTINEHEPKLAMVTDLKTDGQFGEQWLIVTDGKVQVFELEVKNRDSPTRSRWSKLTKFSLNR